MANMRTVEKTVQIGNDGYHPDAPVKGARPVMFRSDEPDAEGNYRWEHKGWLMPPIVVTDLGFYKYAG